MFYLNINVLVWGLWNSCGSCPCASTPRSSSCIMDSRSCPCARTSATCCQLQGGSHSERGCDIV